VRGTHLNVTSQAGFIKIVSESGVASGVRRIEALTGEAALKHFDEEEKLLRDIAQVLKTNPSDSVKRIESLLNEIKAAQKELNS